MPFVDAGGFKLHYLLDGDPSYPTVLLSNSLGADLSMWDAQMEALLPAFRVLRYDTRGHGQSECPDGPSKLTDLGHDVLMLLDALAIDQVHLCGVSLGGLTGMWIGLHAPDRVRSLVLSNTAAKVGTPEVWKDRISKVEVGGLASIADIVVPRWFTSSFQQRSNALSPAKAMLLDCSSCGYLSASAALRDADLRPHIHQLTIPTLVISGEDDLVTPPSDGHALEAAIPGAIFRQVPGAHLSNIEEPAFYNAVLVSFLQQHATREATE